MSQQELLKKIIQVLNDVAIEYMVTGSMVSSLQGEPRSTHDIDLVVDLDISHAEKLIRAFSPPKYFLDEISVSEAIYRRSMFNLIEVKEGDKVVFWLLTDEPFDLSRFSRRMIEEVVGIRIQVSSPEDTILAKLRWAKISGGSEKQFTDALRVYEVQSGKLDVDYLNYWVKKLDLKEIWEKLKNQAEVI